MELDTALVFLLGNSRMTRAALHMAAQRPGRWAYCEELEQLHVFIVFEGKSDKPLGGAIAPAMGGEAPGAKHRS